MRRSGAVGGQLQRTTVARANCHGWFGWTLQEAREAGTGRGRPRLSRSVSGERWHGDPQPAAAAQEAVDGYSEGAWQRTVLYEVMGRTARWRATCG
ncbi:hypothetical protein HPP92_002653 [Vanilla planifolia]|uniref:Uncharacterized protein n=1 Tax=Vanilla planifolia TaxID=51239 RepID=A0A835S266_VANPL|nr:hypothetical protein HPP92_002653 [Vanilla planifolia]